MQYTFTKLTLSIFRLGYLILRTQILNIGQYLIEPCVALRNKPAKLRNRPIRGALIGVWIWNGETRQSFCAACSGVHAEM